MGLSLASVRTTSSRLVFSSRRRSAPTSPSSKSVSIRSYQRSSPLAELVSRSLEKPALSEGLLTQDALVFDEFAQDFVAALCGEHVLGDVAQDRAIQRFDGDSVARASFLTAPTEAPAIVVAIGFAVRIEFARAFELAGIAAARTAQQTRQE